MKTVIALCAAVLALGALTIDAKQPKKQLHAPAEKQELAKKPAPAARQLTEAEQAACDEFLYALRARYLSLQVDGVPVHELIEQSLQEVADERREAFDLVKHVLGFQLKEAEGDIPAGTWILPVPVHFILQ